MKNTYQINITGEALETLIKLLNDKEATSKIKLHKNKAGKYDKITANYKVDENPEPMSLVIPLISL